jgi:amino acid adenylation domain-containing protein
MAGKTGSAARWMTVPALPRAAVLAALVAVIHRRTLREHVGVAVHGEHEVHRFDVGLDDDPTLGDLVARVARLLDRPHDAHSVPTADIRCVIGDREPPVEPGTTGLALPGRAEVTNVVLSDLTNADQLTGQLLTALTAFAAGSTTNRVSCLPLASADQLTLVLGWGGSGRPASPPRAIHELVTERAASNPGAVAVSCAGEVLTYGELDARAARLAARLPAGRSDRQRVIGVLADRSVDLVVGLLATIKSGNAYLALDPDTPADRLAELLSDAAAPVVLAQPALRHRLPPHTVVDEDFGRQAGPARHPAPGDPADRLAYVGYTSGSTGGPKAVCVPHAAVHRLISAPDWAEFRSDDVFLHLAPAAFDASTLEIWGALGNGARLAVFPPGPVSADRLAAVLADEGVTVLWLTAGLFHRMVADAVDAFAGLRHVIAGGDVIARSAVAKLLAAHPHLTFTNGYGPTENTTFTTCWTSTTAPDTEFVPLGRPIGGTRVAIVDPLTRPVPVGVPGELCAAGTGLAHGYLNQPGQTAERFVPDPTASRPGERLYRTGDRARWLPDGTIEFLGRIDLQVKINGFRVEPGEVETVLAGHREVRRVVVTAQPDGGDGRRLLAYVVQAGDAPGLTTRLRDWARARLPAHLVPWALLLIDELPLNANGKVDHSALPAAHRAPRQLAGEYRPPVTPVQRRLAELWAEVLAVEPIGVTDDFFELGGHSLAAGELLAQVHSEFGVEVEARTLYLRPVIAELAEHIDDVTGQPAVLAPKRAVP